jgi:molybdenum cofactor cytidylyltransferase
MVAAIVLAAGLSTRMGGDVPKPLLPWGRHTVVQQVLETLLEAGLAAGQIFLVVGHGRQALEDATAAYGVHWVFNPDYASGEMLSSLQAGLRALPPPCDGALVALADQPQIQTAVATQVLDAFEVGSRQQIVIPSYTMRRGHPVILPRWLCPEILRLPAGATLRAALARHGDAIHYVMVDTPTVLADLDTPAHYAAELGHIQGTDAAQPAQEAP